MKRISLITLMLAAGAFFAACGVPADKPVSNNGNAVNANTAKPMAAAPTKETLMTREKSAYEAWKTKDTKFWDTFLTDDFVGYGMTGRLDRTAAIKQYSGADCVVKSYALSDEQMTQLGADAAVITYKTTYDAICGGQKIPSNTWAAGIYVRSGDKWKGAFHAETPVVDPNAPPAKSAAPAKKEPVAATSDTKPDAMAETLMAVEIKGWDAWKARDVKGVEQVMAKDFMYLSGAGRKMRADAIKGWSEPKCEGLSFSLTEPIAVSLTKDLALV
ncbi:MAG: nuclear transport factor 2 family protein, partial [Pyrinomonadaceae bacterium]